MFMKTFYYLPMALFLIAVIIYFSSINLPLAQNNNDNTSSKEGFVSTSLFNKNKRQLRLASKPYLKMAKKYVPFHFGLLDNL